MMASAALAACSRLEPSSTAASTIPARTLSIGNVTPIRPVEPTNAIPRGRFSAFSVNSAISIASFIPRCPVHAFALPEFTTMACALPDLNLAMHTFTGAAHTWFVVNIPATVAGTLDTISARSRFLPLSEPFPVPNLFMSQNTPEA
jgi:hypothetical protein